MAQKLSGGGRRTSKPSATAPVRTGPAPIGDNAAAGEEAERVQLISIVSQLSAAEDAIEAAQAPLKAARKKRSQIIGLGKAAGFTAKELERRLDEMRVGTREMANLEAREAKHRRWLGIIEPDQSKLILGDQAPQEAKDEAHWRGEGFKAGLRQLAAEAPDGMPTRHLQAFLEEHARGLKQVLEANAPRSTVREQAAADFKEDHPEVDLDAEARRLKASSFMQVGDAVTDDTGAETTIVASDAGTPAERVDDGFEATAEELAAQNPRRALQEVRTAETAETDPV